MVEKKYTYGEILSNSYNFQNLGSIDKAFNDILGIRIFKKLENHEEVIEGEKFSVYKDFYELLREMIDLRHNFIHDINFKTKLTVGDVIEHSNNTHRFVDMLTFYLNSFIDKNKSKFNKPTHIVKF